MTTDLEGAVERLADALIMTGCKDVPELIDMANIGRSMMERMAQIIESGPMRGWSPADDPAEIVTDLANNLDDALHDYGNAESEAKAAEAEVAELKELLTSITRERDALREAGKPFFDLAKTVTTPTPGSPPWWQESQDWTVVFSFAGCSVTLGDLRRAAAFVNGEGG